MTEYTMIRQPDPLTRSGYSLNSEVHEHLINDMIAVRTPRGNYLDTPGNFAKDYGRPFPPIPPGVIEVIYTPGVRHTLGDGRNVVGGGPMPWPPGDEMIAAVQTLIANQEERRRIEEMNRPPIPVPPGSGG